MEGFIDSLGKVNFNKKQIILHYQNYLFILFNFKNLRLKPSIMRFMDPMIKEL
jgi:hypothetical protein